MEEDLIIGDEEQNIPWEYIDYHSYINSGFNALCALEGLDIFNDKKKKARVENAKEQAIDLIVRSIDALVKQFDEEHE